jgi:hypothetical protein
LPADTNKHTTQFWIYFWFLQHRNLQTHIHSPTNIIDVHFCECQAVCK